MNWCEAKNEDIDIGGFQESGCTLGRRSSVGCMGLARFITGQRNLIDHISFLKAEGAAYGAMCQGKVWRARACWQKGTQKYVKTQSSS